PLVQPVNTRDRDWPHSQILAVAVMMDGDARHAPADEATAARAESAGVTADAGHLDAAHRRAAAGARALWQALQRARARTAAVCDPLRSRGHQAGLPGCSRGAAPGRGGARARTDPRAQLRDPARREAAPGATQAD